ncbi:MAG TPA: hypothetical protein DEP66_06260 [Acidimicrobiaceae bacterium]|nr:hypothetical protein [Acidimicrobiaceae bacterium]HCB37792.1 hypothetical protein [Acidimicrobiaceae bacterium]
MTDTASSGTGPSGLDESHHERAPIYRNATFVKWLAQVVALVLVVGGLVFFALQAGDNLRATNAAVDYDFLSVDPGIKIGDGIDTDPNTGGRALWVGMVNTLRMAAAGIVIATVLGVLVGLSRLSPNWLLRKLGSVYVEIIRNIPLLVQIFLLAAILTVLPSVTLDQGPFNGWLHISNKGLSVPRVHASEGFYQWLVILVVGFVVAMFVRRRRVARKDATGEHTRPGLWVLGVMVVFGAVGWFIHPVTAPLGSVFGWVSDFVGTVPPGLVQVLLAALAAGLAIWRIRRFLSQQRTGADVMHLTDDDWFRMIFAAIGALAVVVLVLLLWPGLSSWIVHSGSDLFEVLSNKFGDGRSGMPVGVNRPDVVQAGNFPNYGPSGLNFSVGFAAVFFGVVLYTAAFIAEIVRGGILAVPKGQSEAAAAVGLRRSTSLRRVILPQALRVILPPLGNQYLNLTKNTSLAIAVGYSDIVQVGQTIYNQTGKTLPVVSIWMMFFLACSLSIAVVVNWFNVRLEIKER